MSKKNKTEQVTDQVEGAAVEGVEGDAPASKGRAIMLTDPTSGLEVARKDVIKELYEAGTSRSEIRKILEEKYGHKVAYQIVFASTKMLVAPAKAVAEVAA